MMHLRLRPYDYAAGEFTYGQRLALGDILGDETRSDYQRAKAAWRELYGWSARLMPPRLRAARFEAMLRGIADWVEREQRMLHYTPTADETAAGYEAYCKRVGATGTIYALAKAFSTDPDTILGWPYAKVFGILYHDLEEMKFGRAYDKVITNKTKHYR